MAINYNTMGFNPNLGQLPGFNPQTQGGFFNPHVRNFNFRDDPGYQFRQDEGTRAVQQSAAARGMLGSGATLKGLTRFGQDLASQEYGAAHNRHLQNLQAAEALQQGQFGREYGAAGMQEQLRQGHFGRQQQTAAQQEALRQGQFTRGLGVEQLQEDLRRGQFGRQLNLATLGLQGATSMAGLVNPSIPAFSSPGGFAQVQAPTTSAQLNPQLWANLMSQSATSLGNIGAVMGQGQGLAGQAWQGAFGDIGQMLGKRLEGQGTPPTWGDIGRMFGFGGSQGSPNAASGSLGTNPLGLGSFGFGGL